MGDGINGDVGVYVIHHKGGEFLCWVYGGTMDFLSDMI